jgi:hypothetical protein
MENVISQKLHESLENLISSMPHIVVEVEDQINEITFFSKSKT